MVVQRQEAIDYRYLRVVPVGQGRARCRRAITVIYPLAAAERLLRPANVKSHPDHSGQRFA